MGEVVAMVLDVVLATFREMKDDRRLLSTLFLMVSKAASNNETSCIPVENGIKFINHSEDIMCKYFIYPWLAESDHATSLSLPHT
jgi:hypothetical protein